MQRSRGAKIFAWITLVILVGFTLLAYVAPAVPTRTVEPTEELTTEVTAEVSVIEETLDTEM